METNTIESMEALRALARKSFQTLRRSETDKDNCTIALEINSYAELQLLMLRLLKVATAAIDADLHNVTNVEGTSLAVKNLLEFAVQLIPLEEAYFLDEVFGRLREAE